jgi:hypothetical protein
MGAYVFNGAFTATAYLEGYAIDREGPNVCFSLTFTPSIGSLLGRPPKYMHNPNESIQDSAHQSDAEKRL